LNDPQVISDNWLAAPDWNVVRVHSKRKNATKRERTTFKESSGICYGG
jgi:hypothetical protein